MILYENSILYDPVNELFLRKATASIAASEPARQSSHITSLRLSVAESCVACEGIRRRRRAGYETGLAQRAPAWAWLQLCNNAPHAFSPASTYYKKSCPPASARCATLQPNLSFSVYITTRTATRVCASDGARRPLRHRHSATSLHDYARVLSLTFSQQLQYHKVRGSPATLRVAFSLRSFDPARLEHHLTAGRQETGALELGKESTSGLNSRTYFANLDSLQAFTAPISRHPALARLREIICDLSTCIVAPSLDLQCTSSI